MMEGGLVGPTVGWIHERLCVEGYSSEITIFCRPHTSFGTKSSISFLSSS